MSDWSCILNSHKASSTSCRRLISWGETAKKTHSWPICSVNEHSLIKSTQQKSCFQRRTRSCSDIWTTHNVRNNHSVTFLMVKRSKHVTTRRGCVISVTSWGWWRWRGISHLNRRRHEQGWWGEGKRAETVMRMMVVMTIWERQKTEMEMKTWTAATDWAKKAIRRILKLGVNCCDSTFTTSSMICSATLSISSCSRAVVWSADCSSVTVQAQKQKRLLCMHLKLVSSSTSTTSLRSSVRQCRESSVTFSLTERNAQVDWPNTSHALSAATHRMCVWDRDKRWDSASITTLWCQCAEPSFSEESDASTCCWAWLDRPSPERRSTCSD